MTAKSFYVQRTSPDGREGWTGSLRPLSHAQREAEAWISSGWTADVVPNTPEIREKVRAWQRESRSKRT
jgi:hypothetical protein